MARRRRRQNQLRAQRTKRHHSNRVLQLPTTAHDYNRNQPRRHPQYQHATDHPHWHTTLITEQTAWTILETTTMRPNTHHNSNHFHNRLQPHLSSQRHRLQQPPTTPQHHSPLATPRHRGISVAACWRQAASVASSVLPRCEIRLGCGPSMTPPHRASRLQLQRFPLKA